MVMTPTEGQSSSEATRLAEKSMAAFDAALETTNAADRAANLEHAQDAAGDSALAGAYTFLQKLIGGIAVTLPFVVSIGAYALDGDGIQSSISAYYYTRMGNVFVGALCALGVFFLSYQHKPLPGYTWDNYLAYGASAAAIGVALFPTAEHEAEPWTGGWLVSTAHLLCACALFLLLAFFSLKRFTKTEQGKEMSDAKRKRNVVFKVCGWTIVGTIILVALSNIFEPPDSLHALFFLETIGVVAFGISWLIKSGIFGLLADPVPDAPPASARADISHEVLRVEVVEHADPQVHAEREGDQ